MKHDKIIVAQGCEYSSDTKSTGINNNQIVVGGSGSGKTMSITEPCLLHTNNRNLIVTVTKKRIVSKYVPLLKKKGYNVNILDFTDFKNSTIGFDPLRFVDTPEEIAFLARSLVMANPNKQDSKADPYWDEASISLISALIGAARWQKSNATFADVVKLFNGLRINYSQSNIHTNYDHLFARLNRDEPENPAFMHWESFCHLPGRTAACVMSALSVCMTSLFSQNILGVFNTQDQIDIAKLAEKKNVLFVVTSPVNLSLASLVSVFYSTLLKELFEYAESRESGTLPRDMHIICDDFATGAPIPDFAQYISIIREKGLSVTVLCQSESQLSAMYGSTQATTIINNCDTYVFTGSMDIATARSIGDRMNIPADEALALPIGTFFVFRRGERAKKALRYAILEDPKYIELTEDDRCA